MNVKKAIEIIDANIEFVSLVDKAANKRTFLFAKSEDGQNKFKIYNKLIKADDGSHTVIGIVYEPGTEDAHGNFMKADEIIKAADIFNSEGEGIDVQHNGDIISGVEIVKSWVTTEDQTLYGEVIKEGTWLMEINITDDEIWKSIEDGSITGFSMGGEGTYILEDVEPVAKAEAKTEDNLNIVQKWLKQLGLKDYEIIEKGEVMDRFKMMLRWDSWYNAIWALEDTLLKWDDMDMKWKFEDDPSKITEALTEFNMIISSILNDKSLLEKMISSGVSEDLINKINKRFNKTTEKEGDSEMDQKVIDKAVNDALIKAGIVKVDVEDEKGNEDVSPEMIAIAVEKALDEAGINKPEEATLADMVKKELKSALEKRGASFQIDTENKNVVKADGDRKSVV